MFEANFHAAYTCPDQVDDLFACVQKPNESLWDFIRRFNDIHNTIPDMIEDRVIIAFKQGFKDEKTAEKLAIKNPKMVAELYKIIKATAKATDARARVHRQLDASQSAEDKKKGKDQKRKNGDTEVLAAKKGKALPRRQGKPDDLPVYCPVHRSTRHSMKCSVYKK